MINAIGAYILTLFLVGLVRARPSLKNGETRMLALPLWLHAIILLFFFCMACCSALDWFSSWPFIYWPNLLLTGLNIWVHEAGHFYFCWAGDLLHSFGGTLNEILFPLIPAAFCFVRGYFLLSGSFLYWLGHNCFGIATYIADARAKQLPLLGGDGDSHDWGVILGILNLLESDIVIGKVVFVLGWLLLLLAFALYGYGLYVKLIMPPSLETASQSDNTK